MIINGVSKTYAMTGWRIGYAIGASDVIAAAGKIQSQSTSNPTSIAQAAALEAIRGPQDAVAMMVREFHKRRDVIVERLNAIPGIRCLKPEGAFYVFPNIAGLIGKTANGKKLSSPCDVADYLLEEAKVAGVPGEDFGSHEHIRFSYATSLADIEKGCKRIATRSELANFRIQSFTTKARSKFPNLCLRAFVVRWISFAQSARPCARTTALAAGRFS